MFLIGISAHHPDAAVALFKDGRLVWAAEEERYSRVKHSAGFPAQALKKCLKENGIRPDDLDYVCFGKDPRANFLRKIFFAVRNPSVLRGLFSRINTARKYLRAQEEFCDVLGIKSTALKARFLNVEHHLSHMASAFFVSGFTDAAILSIDGLGDFTSAAWGLGCKNQIKLIDKVFYPHSAGFFYTAGTQFLGFHNFGDEYKVMGLASYGTPRYLNEMRNMYKLMPFGKFELNLDYFVHQKAEFKTNGESDEPDWGFLYSEKWKELFGEPRLPKSIMTQNEMDIAASFQAGLEEILFHTLNYLYQATGSKNLCLAGGVAFNCVANGKIKSRTAFENVYIQPAAGDAGTAIGAAAYASFALNSEQRGFVMDHAAWGSSFDANEIEAVLVDAGITFEKLPETDLLDKTASALVDGKVVGWFQGRMEFGPRAMGSRSILADPRIENIRDLLNAKIKRREMFRPFAPMVLKEKAHDYFEMDCDESPFMLKVFPVKENMKKVIPAVTHVDGSARVQTVTRENNERLWKLLEAFEKKTDVPVLLNTSFNEHEPIVCTPREALECYLKTKMDVLVLGSYFIHRS